jgi:hypothetical protein
MNDMKMKSNTEMPLPSTAICPCGSGRRYGVCCRKKKIEYLVSKTGEVARRMPLSRELVEMLRKHQQDFTELFGRKTGKHDLILFDQFLTGFDETGEILEKISKEVGVREQVIFATRRTGFIVGKHSKKIMPDIDYQEWEDAIDEYFALKESGHDPFHVFTYLTGSEFEKFKDCQSQIKNIIILGFNSIRRHKSLSEETDFFQFLIACSTLNSYRTIYDMFNHRYDDDCLAILRGIYEQYLRIMALRIKPAIADRFRALIYVYVGVWKYKTRKNGTVDYGSVIDPKTNEERRVVLSNFSLVSLSDFAYEADIYGELYNELSGHVHHDVTLWALRSFANNAVSLDRDQDKIRATILILFVTVLLFRELAVAAWLPKQSIRDLGFYNKRLIRKLLDFLKTENVMSRAGVPRCVVPVLTYILAEFPKRSTK